MFQYKKFLAATLVSISLSACAITEDIVPVTYQGSESTISIGADGKSFKLAILDKRGKYKGRIGAKVNGFGAEMADIKSSTPVPEIVQDAFINELTSRKLLVDNDQDRKIDVTITAFHNNFEVGLVSGKARGIVAFTIKVTNKDGVTAFEDAMSRVNVDDGIMLASGENAAASVSKALNTAMSDLFANKEFIDALVKS